MPDITGIAVSALRSSKTALATVSHNIANVDTEGYSRQRVQFNAYPAQGVGSNFVGTGVEINNISRITNQFLTDQLIRDTQSNATFSAYSEYAIRVDSLLGDDSTAITPTLLNYFDAVNDVANDPASIPARQVLLSEGEALANRFNTVYQQINLQNETLNGDMRVVTSQITELARSIASLNNSIQVAGSNGVGQQPNDLLDKRDEALRQLSELVGINVVTEANGSVNVTMGSGQPLVVGADAFTVTATSGQTGISRNEVSLTVNSVTSVVTDQIYGGRLGGLLSVRNELIDPVFNELGRMSLAISNAVNTQHQLGMDLNNQIGGRFFTDINAASAQIGRAAANLGNTGNIAVTVSVDDVSALTTANYNLTYSGGTGNYTLVNRDTNATVATFAAPAVFPATIAVATEGISINMDISSAAALPTTHVDGDRFLITPTRLGASEMGVEIFAPNQIAAALPVRANLPATNTGNGFVQEVQITDTTTADFATTPLQLTPPYQVVFTSPTAYEVYDMTVPAVPVLAGTGVYVPNQSNSLLTNAGLLPAPLAPGYDIVFNGSPETNDVLDITYNLGAVGDNRNMLLLADIQRTKTMANGSATFQDAYAQVVGGVGTRTRDSLIGEEASESILRQTRSQRDSVAGVSLDEEAADLIRFQNAYEASARIIQVSSELFDTILGVIG